MEIDVRAYSTYLNRGTGDWLGGTINADKKLVEGGRNSAFATALNSARLNRYFTIMLTGDAVAVLPAPSQALAVTTWVPVEAFFAFHWYE